jgi:hypothetical protein
LRQLARDAEYLVAASRALLDGPRNG